MWKHFARYAAVQILLAVFPLLWSKNKEEQNKTKNPTNSRQQEEE